MNRQTILNLDGKPFASTETAEQMRDLLNRESEHFQKGNRYRVGVTSDEHNIPKFVVVRARTAKPKPSAARDEVEDHAGEQPGATKIYHPALRVYFFSLPWFMASTAQYLFAKPLWVFILTAMGVTRLPAWIDASLLIDATAWIGLLWLAWMTIGVLLSYYGTTLTVDERGITYQRGILVRDMTHVRFHEIRRVGLRQGLLDRLLNTGLLEFASSGTDDVDIRFIGIANPARVRAEIEERIELKA
ncbi:PH domain-containing protein [Methylotuvimicrobium sp. KM1]|uniref:PH domain-containing protein n=1 Tax=Methylotuvimicrobium sp. KM1 TaxID=3377707 RepID=UPI00384B87A6